MDETRIQANQRLDLVDHTRLMAQLQEAYGDILGSLLGNPRYYTGGSGYQSRPLIVHNFNLTITGALTITCERIWGAGSTTQTAHIYDKDGQRLTGPNSSPSLDYVVTNFVIQGVDRYLIARRVADTTTNETRQFYTAAAGKTAAATDTRTVDAWEISESLEEGGGTNTPAATTVALQSAGWVDIGTFQIDAVPSVTTVTANVPDILVERPLTWAIAPPDTDQLPMNIFELLAGIQQILERMRNARDWHDDPSYDATFHQEGGIRLAGGVSAARGLENMLINAQNGALAGSGHALVSFQKATLGSADDFLLIRSKAVIAGDNTLSGAPSSDATPSGFLYSNNTAPTTFPTHLSAVDKYWSVPACDMLIGENNNQEPWNAPPTLNEWYMNEVSTGTALAGNNFMEWRMNTNYAGGAGAQYQALGLFVPIQVPHACLLHTVTLQISVSPAFHADQELAYTIISLDGTTRANVSTPATVNYGTTGIKNISVSPTATTIIDNSTYTYYLLVRSGTNGTAGGFTSDAFGVLKAVIRTQIREASHVY